MAVDSGAVRTNAAARYRVLLRRAVSSWRLVLFRALDDEALHRALSSLALVSRRKLAHRSLKVFVSRVGEILAARMDDDRTVEKCCAFLLNMSTSAPDQIAGLSATLLEAARHHQKEASGISITFSVVYDSIAERVVRQDVCAFALKMLALDTKMKRASGVALLSRVLRAEDGREVLRAENAFECVRAAWPNLPLALPWIRPMFQILRLDTTPRAPCEGGAPDLRAELSGEDGLSRHDSSPGEVCSVCLDSKTDRRLACRHAFCERCIRTHVTTCIIGDGSTCEACCRASIPRCPLCRTSLTSAEILSYL